MCICLYNDRKWLACPFLYFETSTAHEWIYFYFLAFSQFCTYRNYIFCGASVTQIKKPGISNVEVATVPEWTQSDQYFAHLFITFWPQCFCWDFMQLNTLFMKSHCSNISCVRYIYLLHQFDLLQTLFIATEDLSCDWADLGQASILIFCLVFKHIEFCNSSPNLIN